MTIAPGTKLGPYEVTGPIAAGGMGEVYRARDPRLGRDVALKILTGEIHPDLVARFGQEARAASSIQHPSIVTVYEVGDSASGPYLAMELVDGRSLRELLEDGPLPARKALTIAAQVADGLAAAHARGVVHRDLKPENIMVTKEGMARILDFGLAKVEVPHAAESDSTLTWQRLKTQPGTVLGTVGYMSPEQASGRPADFRTDQFSLGSVLYELLTGHRAFQGPTPMETLSAILRDEPEPISSLDARIPPPVRWIVDRCLAKDPDERYASTLDLARDLANVRNFLSQATSGSALAIEPLRRRPWIPAAVVAGALALAAAAFLLGRGFTPRDDPSFTRLTFRRGSVGSARFSPDGQTIVFSARWQQEAPRFYLTRRDGIAHPLPVTGIDPVATNIDAISRAGEMALVVNGGQLLRMPFLGGAPRVVAEGVGSAGWAPDGERLAVVREMGGKSRLEYPIGKTLYETSGSLRFPRPSPDGRSVAVLEGAFHNDTRGWVTLIGEDGKPRRLTREFEAIAMLLWHPTKRELWFGALPAGGSFSIFAVTPSGKERRVLGALGDFALRDVAPDGTALVARNNLWREAIGLAPGEMVERDLTWRESTIPIDLSDDGKTMLFAEETSGIYTTLLRATDASPAVRLGEGAPQALSPDGKWALTIAIKPSPAQILLLPTAAGEPQQLTNDALNHSRATFTPDGKRIVFSGSEPGKGERLYVQEIGSPTARPITPEGVRFLSASMRHVLPDGRVMARSADGRTLLYPLDGGEPQPVPGLESADVPVRGDATGSFLFVRRNSDSSIDVQRIELATGRREPWKTLTVSDPVGVFGVRRFLLTPDGRGYVQSCTRYLSELYLVKGLR